MPKKCLIVEGGGFKTGFTLGILDAFISCQFRPFDFYIGISGGSTAISYFLSGQYRQGLSAMRLLAKDDQFLDFRRALDRQGYMDIDFLAKVAEERIPFDLDKALAAAQQAEVRFVATNRLTGQAEYLIPNRENWLDIIIASSTLPFVTKGKHIINEVEYFDGGWSDPLPVKWAYEQGADDILVLRTWPEETRSTQSWTDYFGSIYFNDSPALREIFANCHLRYNEGVEFIENPPSDLTIQQIAPSKLLKSGTYSYSKKTIMSDYRYGVDQGLVYVNQQRN